MKQILFPDLFTLDKNSKSDYIQTIIKNQVNIEFTRIFQYKNRYSLQIIQTGLPELQLVIQNILDNDCQSVKGYLLKIYILST